MRYGRTRGWALVAVMALLATALAACATNDKSDGDSASTSAKAAATTGASTATGPAVKVMVMLDESDSAGIKYPDARAGADARVARINAEGGIGTAKNKVEIEYCLTNLDPNAAAACARKAADDPSVIAVAGAVTAGGTAAYPILQDAGIPSIGPVVLGLAEGTSPVSFPVQAGLVGSMGGQVTILVDKADAKKVSVIVVDTPAADIAVTLTKQILASRGLELAARIPVPVGKADVSAEVAKANQSGDSVVLATDTNTALAVIKSAAQLAPTLKIATTGNVTGPDNLKALGSAANGVYVAMWYATDDMGGPGNAAYLADLESIGKADISDQLAKNSWLAFDLLDKAAASLPKVDRASLLAALNATSSFKTGGLTPDLDFTTPGTLLNGAQPRIVNSTMVYAQVKDGKTVAISKGFVKPFDTPGS